MFLYWHDVKLGYKQDQSLGKTLHFYVMFYFQYLDLYNITALIEKLGKWNIKSSKTNYKCI